MKITTITVHSGYTHPHPEHSFANLRGAIELTAELESNDDLETSIKRLQIAADAAANQHRQRQIDVIVASMALQREPQREIDVPF